MYIYYIYIYEAEVEIGRKSKSHALNKNCLKQTKMYTHMHNTYNIYHVYTTKVDSMYNTLKIK